MTRIRLLFLFVAFLLSSFSFSQTNSPANEHCGSDKLMDKWLQQSTNRKLHDQIEKQLLEYRKHNPLPNQPNVVVTLPVVVHIIHNNGPENISDAQVLQGIQHLNQAFANISPYDPSDGVDCQIQFCLARRDPNGNATNGITRNVSTLTNMNMDTDDISVKNLNRWNPLCYINIWLVNEICNSGGCGVAGYAYLPSAHGSNVDGIVQEARWFGSNSGNSVVQIHEMGHYLGLYHTFQGGCTNNNCLTDGDRVCDTPPDQTTAGVGCSGVINSCSTDVLSGFATDQNDLSRDYMDYGSIQCFSMFTQGQADRMNWHITNVRSSLLNCMSCLDPCPAPVTANFTSPGATVNAGSSFLFTNTSANATSYEWYVNGVLQSTAINFNFTFSAIGSYTIKLVAKSSSPLCQNNEKTVVINAVCPATAGFTKSAAIVPCGTNINFTNTSTGATNYEWYVNGVLQSTGTNFTYTNTVAGRYGIKLVARNTTLNCSKEFIDTVEYTCSVVAAFTPNGGSVNMNTPVTFTNASVGATTFQWLVNGTPAATTPNFTYSFTTPGNYVIMLVAGNGICATSQTAYYVSIDTCLRQTFQKTYGAVASDEFIQDLRSTADGGFIAAGRTNGFGSGNYNALAIKYDNKGVIQWTKTFGGAGADLFYRIKPVSGGGYIAVGNTLSYGTPAGDALVVYLNAQGNTIWARRFSENTANGEFAANVIQTSDGGFLVCGTQNRAGGTANAMLIKLDVNGNMQWNRLYDMGNTDEGGSVYEDNNAYLLYGQFRGNTFHDLYLLKVSKANGAILSSSTYDVGGVNNFAADIVKVGSYYELTYNNVNDFSPVPVNQRAGVLRIDSLGNIIHSKYLNAASTTAAGSIIPLSDGSYLAGHSESSGADLQLFKYNTAGIQQWGSKFVQTGEQLCYTVNPSADGGFLVGGATKAGVASAADVIVVKTDITGNTPGCNVQPVTAALTNITTTANGSLGFTTRNLNFLSPVINLYDTLINIPMTQFCNSTSCATPATDTCSQNTFQKAFGGTADDYINDVKNTPGGGYIAVGVTNSFGAGSNDAALIKLDNAGNITWNKIIGTPNSEYLGRVINTADGGYLAAGHSLPVGSAAYQGWLLKTDAAGTIQWSRTYTDGNPNGTVIWDVCQTSDGGYAFCGAYKYTPSVVEAFVTRVNAAGTVIWSRYYGAVSSDQAYGILENNGQLIVSSFGAALSGTFYDGVMMKLNMANGNVIAATRFDIESRSNWFTQLHKMPNGDYLVGCNNSDDFLATNFNEVLLVLDSSTFTVKRIMRANAPTIRSGAAGIAPLSDGGIALVEAEPAPGTADAYLRRMDATGNITIRKRYGTAATGEQLFNVVQAPDKGFFGGGRYYPTAASSDFLIIKTDPVGNLGGTCTVQPGNGDNTTPQFNSGAFTWPGTGTVTIPANNTLNVQSISVSLTTASSCTGPTCTPITDSCSVSTFQKIIVGSGDDYGYMVKKANTGGGYIIAGQSSTNSAGSGDAMLVRTTNDGAIVWAKNFGGTGNDYFADAEQTSTGGIIAVGQTRSLGNANGAAFLVYTDPGGNLIWSKAFNSNSAGGDFLRDVIQTADGGFAALGSTNAGAGTSDLLLVKTDGAGNIQWSKRYATGTTDEGCALLEEGDTLVLAGYFLGSSSHDAFIMKVRKSTGALIWSKGIDVDNDNNGLYRIQRINGGYSLHVPTTAGLTNNNSRQTVLKTDNNGNVTYSHKLTSATNKPLGDKVIYNLNGGYTSTASEETNGDVHFYNLNNQKQAVWKKRFTRAGSQTVYELAQENGGYFYMSGTHNTGGTNDILFIRTDAGGNTNNCTMDSTDLVITQPVIVPRNYSPTENNITFANVANINPTITNISFTLTELCSSQTRCDSLKLSGPDSSCRLQDTLTYSVKRSAGCTAPVFFTITPNTGFQLIASTDSTIKIKIALAGQYLLKARIETPCGMLEDSILITTFNSLSSVNLGPDVNLCANSTVTLHAGPGFKTYLWQDGAADSVYTASFPGTYHVTVEDFCGNIYRDTVVINVAPNVPFDLGPDRVRCNNDTLTITAPSGFTNYTWASNYNISSLTGQTVQVWPAIDTIYTVVAEKAYGCQVFDTIRVRAYVSPPINLGNDTSFCAGNNIVLNAGAGFTGYLWSTGAVTPSITVTTAGTYWVEGTTAQGCKSRDTLRVLNVFALPAVNLGADTSLCQGSSLVLNAGNPGSTYLWQNGTTTQTLTVNATGLYWVEVTNANGCRVRDSLTVLNVFPRPPINLGNDTSFCAGNNVILNAGTGFASYIWNTGAATQTLTVNTAGLYWVEGTTAQGCKSRDTLNVLNVFAVPVVNLGNDTSLCAGNNLVLNAGNPGSTYLWNTGATTQTITVNTAAQYWVQVTNANGCRTRDTLNLLNIFPAPNINMGNDTSFCAGGSVVLNAGPGFSNYLWQNGATTQTITANTAGWYWVEVANANGCKKRDSLQILNVFPQPVVNLGRDTILCAGGALTLNAGNPGFSYLWSTGATTQTITVNAVGTYWVRVTGAGSCTATDTLRVLNIGALPANFIAPRTGMCLYEPFYIHAQTGFATYLWSTGATRDSALITQPGNYWVEVTTADGCSARENFEVFDKNCVEEIYFPTGFTPNRDGRNDIYKPGIFGLLKNYRLEIYNRFGQQVFVTTDPSRGWDGTYKGVAQDVGTFVYMCHYQFKDKAAGFGKGTLVLIR